MHHVQLILDSLFQTATVRAVAVFASVAAVDDAHVQAGNLQLQQ